MQSFSLITNLITFALICALLATLWKLYRPRLRRLWRQQVKPRLPRQWKPKSPDDCPHCCAGVTLERQPVPREVIPYSERQSTRGRKKSISTQGFACPNPDCDYFAVTDHKKHALVGNGKWGKNKTIQHLLCRVPRWCHTDFSVRRGTPLYYITTELNRVDPITKIIPSLHLGHRCTLDALALLHDLKLRLAANCLPAFTSDGLRAYFYALTAHFGCWFCPFRARKLHWRVDPRLLYGLPAVSADELAAG